MAERNRRRADVKLFQDQTQSDAVDVSFIMGSSSSLNEVEAEKGVVVGRVVEAEGGGGVVVGNLTFSDNGDVIDCTKMGIGGKPIPLNIDVGEDMESNALFILLVEKEGAYIRLASERFYDRFPCIIIAAKGQPDVATQFFLRKIELKFKIPILALVGCDPDGLKIMSMYMCGSKNIYSANLTTLDVKWVGIRPSDLDKHKIPEECRLTMTQQDIKIVKDLLEEDFVKKNPGWVRELELMVKTKQKAEIHALCSFGFQYLSMVYLPLKLQEQDWL